MTTFIAMLGHELRNPLAPIMNAVSIMQMEPELSERLRKCRDVVARQGHQLTRLIDDLLDVGRITSGKIHLATQPVALAAILRDSVEAMTPLLQAGRHRWSLTLPDEAMWVSGDRARLVQVFSNLLNNAAKFTPDGGEIGVELRHVGDSAAISVRDNGPGIPASQIDNIFNLFVQGENTQQHPQGGLGLGLSLVRQIVELHHGDVSVYSAGQPGKGAEFVIRLPLIPAPE